MIRFDFFDPTIVAVSIEFRDKSLLIGACCEIGTTKVGCALKFTNDDTAAITVSADIVNTPPLSQIELIGPEKVAVVIELGDKAFYGAFALPSGAVCLCLLAIEP